MGSGGVYKITGPSPTWLNAWLHGSSILLFFFLQMGITLAEEINDPNLSQTTAPQISSQWMLPQGDHFPSGHECPIVLKLSSPLYWEPRIQEQNPAPSWPRELSLELIDREQRVSAGQRHIQLHYRLLLNSSQGNVRLPHHTIVWQNIKHHQNMSSRLQGIQLYFTRDAQPTVPSLNFETRPKHNRAPLSPWWLALIVASVGLWTFIKSRNTPPSRSEVSLHERLQAEQLSPETWIQLKAEIESYPLNSIEKQQWQKIQYAGEQQREEQVALAKEFFRKVHYQDRPSNHDLPDHNSNKGLS